MSIGYGYAHVFGDMEHWLFLYLFSNLLLYFSRFFIIVVPSRRPPTSTAPLSSRATTNLPRPEERLGPCKYPPPPLRHFGKVSTRGSGASRPLCRIFRTLVLWFFLFLIFHHSQYLFVTSHLLFFFSFSLYFTFSFCTIPCTLSILHAQHYHQSISQANRHRFTYPKNTSGFANNHCARKICVFLIYKQTSDSKGAG